MTDFEPMRDFFHRRQAKILTEGSQQNSEKIVR